MQLTGLLLPRSQCPSIGKEVGKNIHDGITVFFQSICLYQPNSPYPKGGSYRFIRVIDGEIVAGMQVMSETGRDGTVANVYCAENWRRHGFATELFLNAQTLLGDIEVSSDLSEDGRAWMTSLDIQARPEI
jgi:hypothetical protein